jgi:hypothetical protein
MAAVAVVGLTHEKRHSRADLLTQNRTALPNLLSGNRTESRVEEGNGGVAGCEHTMKRILQWMEPSLRRLSHGNGRDESMNGIRRKGDRVDMSSAWVWGSGLGGLRTCETQLKND